MKLALLGASLYSQGAEFVLATVARGLSQRGHDIHVIVNGIHKKIAKEHPYQAPFDVGDKVKVLVIDSVRARDSIGELRAIFKAEHYDCVMCHHAPFALPMLIAAFGLEQKNVYVEHLGGIGADLEGKRIENKFTVVSYLKNSLMRLYDAQLAVSKGTLEAINRMTGYPKEKLHLVYNPVFDSLPDNFERKVDVECPIVMAAGALGRIKHFDLLIDAFSKVHQSNPTARLVIWGEGIERATLLKQINNLGLNHVVSLPGFTNQLPLELKQASCFVVSSYVESFSIVLVEAMAAGVPVVSVDAPYGPREILQDGKNGILVDNNNVDALAAGICKVLNGQGITPAQSMIERFSVANVAKRYEDVLLKIISAS